MLLIKKLFLPFWKTLKVIMFDFLGLIRVCGIFVAVLWLLKIISHYHQCRQRGDLLPVDRSLGNGPFKVRYGKARAVLSGDFIISGIREIWIRDSYLGGGFLFIPPHATVLDFGSNMGVFTILALAHGPQVHVVAVEPSLELRGKFMRNLHLNGWEKRATLCGHFLGIAGDVRYPFEKVEDFKGTKFLTEDDFLRLYPQEKIDFIKCDIEGSEFGFFGENSKLLQRTGQVAIEIHARTGNIDRFIHKLHSYGFETCIRQRDAIGCLCLARRSSSTG